MSRLLCLPVAFSLLAFCTACATRPELAQAGPQTAGPERASCGALTVQAGAVAGEVLSVCGQPTYRDAWGGPAVAQGSNLATVEDWYYNAGPATPVQVLRLLNGQLVSVQQDGFGFEPAKAPMSCETRAITPGLSKYRLVNLCGQPLTRQAYVIDASFVTPNSPAFSQGTALFVGQSQNAKPAYREDLAYKLSGSVQTVTVENGRVLTVALAARN